MLLRRRYRVQVMVRRRSRGSSLTHNSLASARATVKDAMDKAGRDMKRDGGIRVLPPHNREAAENLLAQLSEYGVFVVRGGELESSVRHLDATGHGPSWLMKVFEKWERIPITRSFSGRLRTMFGNSCRA